MRNFKKTICILLSVIVIFASMGIASSAAYVGDGRKGSFNILNYNIDGLPIPSSMANGERDAFEDTILIAQILNKSEYDIVAVQEDFNYDIYFRPEMTKYANSYDFFNNIVERHQTDHSGGVPAGDGMNIFSLFPLYTVRRVAWEQSCGVTTDGSDELTPKGIMVTTIQLEDGYYLDLYNIHVDAYGGEGSIAARHAQFTQLANYIMKHSVYDPETGVYDHAVIVTGDFNANIYKEEEATGDCIVKNLLEAAHLNDAWAVQTIDSITENPEDYEAYYDYARRTNITYSQAWGHYDSVERFCYADGNGIDLTLDSFKYVQICDSTGRSLSDHSAAEAEFSYEIVDKVQDYEYDHDNITNDADQPFLIKFLNYIVGIFRALGRLLQDWANWAK